jgi:Endo-alpha-N-acetylgalactosaminidase
MVGDRRAYHHPPVRTACFKFPVSSIFAAGLCAAFTVVSPSLAAEEISGAYYDHTITNRPERPWMLPYDRTLVTKIFLCSRTGTGEAGHVYQTFSQALETIQRLDRITAGIPKVVYLVGWQHNGHDSKWPDWSVVNPALKRAEDATALDSLRWLIREGAKHHTRVSLHINMFDAYEDSPLWQSYLDQNIIAKDTQGNVIFGETHDGMRSSQISYTREWELGLAQQKIDNLLAMIPELAGTGTIHIDAFHSMRPLGQNQPISPLLGHSVETEAATQRKIYRYWRNKGLDVTSEGAGFLRPDAFVGLQPFSWANEGIVQSLPDRLYGSTPMRAEPEIKQDAVNLPGLLQQFSQNVMPWYITNVQGAAPAASLTANGNTMLPALWKNELALVAFSQNGYTGQEWELPATWRGVNRVRAVIISLTEPEAPVEIPVTDGKITLTLAAGTARLLTAIDPPQPGESSLLNPSFETPATPLYSTPAGWAVLAGSGFTHPAAGGLVPTHGALAVALGNTSDVVDRLSQEIPPPATATIYRIRFSIGWRNDDGSDLSVLREGGVRIYLGGTLLAEKFKTFSATSGDTLGGFQTLEATFTTPNDRNPNSALRVELVGNSANGIQTWFDQVELETVALFRISAMTYSLASIRLRWNSEFGRTYRIESSPDLYSWSPVGAPIPGTYPTTETDIPTPDLPRCFFRVTLA